METKINKAINAGINVIAIWYQDWQGIRMTSFGRQLFKNWEYGGERYLSTV